MRTTPEPDQILLFLIIQNATLNPDAAAAAQPGFAMSSLRCLLALAVSLAFAAFAPQEAAAQAPKAVSLELNNARDASGGCRLTYIAMNGTGVVLDKASYEIVVFDSEAKVAQFLILEFGRLATGKTKVVEFDFPNRPCKGIKRILVNDVADCVSGGQPSTLCIDGLQTATRTDIEFGQ